MNESRDNREQGRASRDKWGAEVPASGCQLDPGASGPHPGAGQVVVVVDAGNVGGAHNEKAQEGESSGSTVPGRRKEELRVGSYD